MDVIAVVGLSNTSRTEKTRLPSMHKSRRSILNTSQLITAEVSDELCEKKNLSMNFDLFEQLDSSRGLKKFITIKKTEEDNEKPELGIKGIITPTHARILKPIIKKPSFPIAGAKKRKPLKLLEKLPPKMNFKQEIFVY